MKPYYIRIERGRYYVTDRATQEVLCHTSNLVLARKLCNQYNEQPLEATLPEEVNYAGDSRLINQTVGETFHHDHYRRVCEARGYDAEVGSVEAR